MSFSRYDEDGARTSHHTHCCIGARRATHCATGDDMYSIVLYCILLYYVLNKLQLVQNNAARLVAREKESSHVTPLLKQLHWLPIEYRIKYKIVLNVYKCLHEMGPVYLTSLLTGYHPGTSMCLRSDKEELLDNKRTAKGYGDRAFAKSGPELWNALPLNIRNSSSVTAFKSSIKTDYYKICYVWKIYEHTLKLYYEHC